jgi:hypothetical protein
MHSGCNDTPKHESWVEKIVGRTFTGLSVLCVSGIILFLLWKAYEQLGFWFILVPVTLVVSYCIGYLILEV